MYTKKNKDIIGSIKSNRNNIIYFALLMTMLAAICIIAACVVFSMNSNEPDLNEVTTEESDTLYENANTTETDIIETTHSIHETENSNISIYETRLYVFLKESFIAAVNYDVTYDKCEILALIDCKISDRISNLCSRTDVYEVYNNLEKTDKALWKKIKAEDNYYYLRYYTNINGIVFSSALYEQNGDAGTIIPESYSSIVNKDFVTPYNNESIMVTIASAKWLFENIPSSTHIYVCKDIKSASIVELAPCESILYLQENTIDKEFYIMGKLLDIPSGYYYDPTDEEATKVYYDGVVKEIKNTKEVVCEFGELSYDALSPDSAEIMELFSDVKLYDDNGNDISEYLKIYIDTTQYTQQQLGYYNYNGLLWPNRYPVKIVAADLNGNIISSYNYISLIDRTAPKISLVNDITEIHNDMIYNRDYILSLVTVNELCKLSPDGLSYDLINDHTDVYIHYTATDYFGNVGELDIKLSKVY